MGEMLQSIFTALHWTLFIPCTGELQMGSNTPVVALSVLSRGEGSSPSPPGNTIAAQDIVHLLCPHGQLRVEAQMLNRDS